MLNILRFAHGWLFNQYIINLENNAFIYNPCHPTHFADWLAHQEACIASHDSYRLQRRGNQLYTIIQVEQVFTDSYALRDRRIRLGTGTKRTSFITLRLIEVRSGKTWHSYLTSVLDPTIL